MTPKQNYIARMELNKKNRLASGLVSARFPEVANMVIYMTYYQNGANPVLMLRTVNILPKEYAYFKMECMIKGCLNGGFDLTKPVSEMVKNRKKSGKGKLVCKGKCDGVTIDHASIDYEITIEYNKPSKRAAAS